MSERTTHRAATARTGESLTTPTGLQANTVLQRRRLFVLAACISTWVMLLIWAAGILAVGGWTWVDCLLFVGGMFGTPWAVLGFWNAVLGLWLLHGTRHAREAVAPYTAAAGAGPPLAARTAVLMTLRNEAPERAIRRLEIVKSSLDATGEGAAFSYFLLSDTDKPEIAAAEEKAVADWRARDHGAEHIVYRRRARNDGYKAGNVRDFCEVYGGDFELMLPLDADSLMTGAAIIDLVRIMQTHTEIGILQSLVVGAPAASPFSRIFQFGMRLGMRTYTMGQAWWTGDCGPFWGHNALVRLAPFRDHCRLPVLPGGPPFGGHVLSHDQVEAVLMRRAGYEVRVMPFESGSYEDNPPDVLEFIRRDVRWCQGNLQYLKLLAMPDLRPVSRFQLVWAILMFIGVPAWTGMIALLPLAALEAQGTQDFPAPSAKALYVTFLALYLAPKIAGAIDALLRRGEAARFGGTLRFLSGAAIELVFSFLQGAISTIHTSIFMIGLLFGRTVVWSGQQRDAQGLTWRGTARALWPQTLFGVLVTTALAVISPTVLLWSLPLTAGYILAVPFALVTASPALGRFMHKHGLAGIPEDFAPPFEIVALNALPPRGERPVVTPT